MAADIGHRGAHARSPTTDVWLPYAAAHYIEVTGDLGVLDEMVPFLDGPALRAGEPDSYFQPMVSEEQATLFEHCARALDRSLAVGGHGLPLIGSGDWNDGMNRVGSGGKGESVWLGWFLHATLSAFAPLADGRVERTRATTWRSCATALRESLEREAWDGDWYRRGYFDDGTPLGSASSAECRIDSIAQSWAVISRAADPARAARAMAASTNSSCAAVRDWSSSSRRRSIRERSILGISKDTRPASARTAANTRMPPLWSVLAFAMLGDGDKAGELFSILNPINHASTRAAVHGYKVEPYVACADVYAEPPHVGRGGWTWYTGSAGWMYRAGLEWILGFQVRGATLVLDPCVPRTWRGFEIVFRYRSARYDIAVENPRGVTRGVARADLDGAALPAARPENPTRIPLVDDGATHRVRVVLG